MGEKSFYKKLNPELFSDSKVVKKGNLSEDYFSYFLESLTSQSKEKEFEDYCRQIVGVTICPNLLPQTGPTGGGDSKVDSETIPVSESLAESWISGYGDLAYKERWAFAISAKKEWKPKFKSDVKKIIGTNKEHNRDYKKIFFITNQFVSDKKRADAEDELRKEYEIDIRILDRTWLLENTFKDNNQLLAIKSFNMSEDLLDVVEEGVRDIERRRRLENINESLLNVENLKPSKIVNLSQESVELARELELDKTSVTGILERNLRFTKKYGHSQDYINALYDYGWTMLWWYEDRQIYYEKYLEIEKIYKEHRDNYSTLKKLSTLWITLNSNHVKGKANIDSMDDHTQFLEKSFDIFINDKENPKRAKLARFDYQMMRLQNIELWDEVVLEYLSILDDMNYNTDIDLFELKKILELPILKESPNYDDLFEKMIDMLGEQSKNVSSSQLLVNRGNDYLETNPYTSIKYYSRALSKLYQEESKIDLIKVLISLGTAFERIGLAWSARSYYVKAYMNSFNLYFDEGTAIPGVFLTMRALKMLELKLGRIDYSLEMNELEIEGLNLYPYDINEEAELEKYSYYDLLLAICFLNFSFEDINRVSKLPDYLSNIGLDTSSASIKYKLGYYDEEYMKALGSIAEVDRFMEKLYDQPASENLKKNLNIEELTGMITLKTKILGCNVTVESQRNRIKEELGASILAMLENTFATAIVDEIMPTLGKFEIKILDGKENVFSIKVNQNKNVIEVVVSKINDLIEFSNREVVFEKISSIVGIFISQMLIFEKDFQKFKESFEKDHIMFRTFNHSSTLDTFLTYENDKLNLNDHQKEYINLREKDVFNNRIKNIVRETIDNDNEEEEKEKFDLTKVTHEEVKISDVISIPLWEKALWKGLLAIPENFLGDTPYIGLVFQNKAGLDIFSKWIKDNNQKKITIGIITGINKRYPYWYRVIIGENLFNQEKQSDQNNQLFGLTTRLHTMEAKNDNTINMLKQIIKNNNEFSFIPVLEKDLEINRFRKKLSFMKSIDSIIMKDVSEINEKDYFLHTGILPIDNPVNISKKRRFIDLHIEEKKNSL